MAYALETRTEERPAEAAGGFALSDLWMLPLLVLALIFDKFRRHLARLGQDLDLAALSYDPEPPETFQPPMPRSALSMHRRLEDLARFHADLERYIRRHATRIAARTSFARRDPNPANPANLLSGPNPDPANFQTAIPNFRLARPVAIRAPP